jgi:hypothetical protein
LSCPEIALDFAEFFFFSSAFLDISPEKTIKIKDNREIAAIVIHISLYSE